MNLNDKLKLEKTGMTHNQLKELRYHYVDRLVDNMSLKDLVTYVTDDLMQYVSDVFGKIMLERRWVEWGPTVGQR